MLNKYIQIQLNFFSFCLIDSRQQQQLNAVSTWPRKKINLLNLNGNRCQCVHPLAPPLPASNVIVP